LVLLLVVAVFLAGTAPSVVHADPAYTKGGLLNWVWMMPGGVGGTYGYSVDQANWLYFHASDDVWTRNMNTAQWTTNGLSGWNYVVWPYTYSVADAAWFYVYPPADGWWVYDYATVQWWSLPRSP